VTSGAADPEITRKHAESHALLSFHDLGDSGLRVSEVGFGCYRVDISVEEHRAALTRALHGGINVLDTSSNYSDGGSERLVGKVLKETLDSGAMDRRAVAVVSKGGYLQGNALAASRKRRDSGRPFPEIVPYATGLAHCIHPEFLEDQITGSLDRLGLETVDVYLLHNPEYYLGWAHRSNIPLPEARDAYYRRIEKAFRHLEQEADRGRISWYGVSSNAFPYSPDHPEFTALETLWDLAASVSPGARFKVVEFPMNLLEPEALTRPNQPSGGGVLEFARSRRLGVLVNRPLNALAEDRLIRLADVDMITPAGALVVDTRLRNLIQSEEALASSVLENLPFKDSLKQQLLGTLRIGEMLRNRWKTFGSYIQWQETQTTYLLPRVQRVIQFLADQELTPHQMEQVEAHILQIQEALHAIGSMYQAEAARITRRIREWAGRADPEWNGAESLSRLAVRSLRSTRGISSVLVGMRREGYVDEMLLECSHALNITEKRDESWARLESTRPNV